MLSVFWSDDNKSLFANFLLLLSFSKMITGSYGSRPSSPSPTLTARKSLLTC
jgi:hypothetical protein